jgi:hypothetical protein
MGESAYRILAVKPDRKRPLEDLNVNGRIILKIISQIFDRDVNWIHMAQDRDRWRAPVNTR